MVKRLAMPAGLRRYYGKGHLHFITFRCYRRLPLLKSAGARDIFVRELAKVRDELGFRLIGYVVMPEQVHLLMSEPQRGTPSTALRFPISIFYFRSYWGLPGCASLTFGSLGSGCAAVLAAMGFAGSVLKRVK